jgi:hypothetical protein
MSETDTVRAKWEEFAKGATEIGMTAQQLRRVEPAFWCGAHAMLYLVMRIVADDGEDGDGALEARAVAIEALHDEITARLREEALQF